MSFIREPIVQMPFCPVTVSTRKCHFMNFRQFYTMRNCSTVRNSVSVLCIVFSETAIMMRYAQLQLRSHHYNICKNSLTNALSQISFFPAIFFQERQWVSIQKKHDAKPEGFMRAHISKMKVVETQTAR